MKKFIFLIFCVPMLFGRVSAQNLPTASTKIYYNFNKKPSFPGGNQARLAFLARHIRYPQDALNNNITGKVYASFIVEPDGSISHIKILKGLGYGCDAELKRLILLMPKWKPGIVGGKPVRSYVTQVISFRMKHNEKAYTHVDRLPVFAVGKAGIEHFFSLHLWYPMRTLNGQVVDTVLVGFEVGPYCLISHLRLIPPKVKKNAYDYEALRVVPLLRVIHPAMLHGKPVPVKLYVPVVFDHKNVDMKGGHYKTVEYDSVKFRYFIPKGHLPEMYNTEKRKIPRRNKAQTREKDNQSGAYAIVDTMPQFRGGVAYLMRYLTENMVYPEIARDNGCAGTVILHFVVEPDGSISNVKVSKGVCPLLDNEAVKVVEGMPKWIPGRLKGKPFRVKFKLPVNFAPGEKERRQQVSGRNGKTDATGRIFLVVDKMPQFPGGMAYLMRYLTEHIEYPAAAMDTGCSGTVVLRFVVEPDGSISNVEVLKSVCPYLDNEAVKVVEGMPKWIPGSLKGKPVRVSFNLPVRFSMR